MVVSASGVLSWTLPSRMFVVTNDHPILSAANLYIIFQMFQKVCYGVFNIAIVLSYTRIRNGTRTGSRFSDSLRFNFRMLELNLHVCSRARTTQSYTRCLYQGIHFCAPPRTRESRDTIGDSARPWSDRVEPNREAIYGYQVVHPFSS
ncbi:hypothetical protein ARMGADRAFT_77792 [Armillaria gallica]|uniref:Uncharacterized protein n=1 Tax=Armillaria gallica TaxID=47427 RepID=A0A2H3CBH5_ARMGA|nr:hypothetical protein ARMGADRAFT_77792 [Armillaria gallica]